MQTKTKHKTPNPVVTKKPVASTPAANAADRAVTALQKRPPTTTLALLTQAESLNHDAFAIMATILSSPTLTPGGLTEAFDTIRKWGKVVEDQKKVARELLLNLAEEHGEEEKDGRVKKVEVKYNGDNFHVRRLTKVATKPDDELTTALLNVKRIALTEGMDQEVSYTANQQKLQELVNLQRISAEDYTSLFKVLSTQLEVEKQ